MSTIATITGKLTLVIADGTSVDLGDITLPIIGRTVLRNGELCLVASPNMRELRELIEQAFHTVASDPEEAK